MSITPALARPLAVAALAALALTACSGGSDENAATPSPIGQPSFQADPGATPTPSATASEPAEASAEPSAGPTAEPSTSGTAARDVPTDAEATQKTDDFLSDLQGEFYNLAWLEMCDAGRARFTNGAALQAELGLKEKTVKSYTLGGVTADTFNDDPRKKVAAAVVYSDGQSENLSFSITLEDSEAAVCGF